jgi:hypothetical protein
MARTIRVRKTFDGDWRAHMCVRQRNGVVINIMSADYGSRRNGKSRSEAFNVVKAAALKHGIRVKS